MLPQAGQDRRVANRHPEPSHQSFRGPSASAMAEHPDDSRHASGSARERRRKIRHALGEDAPIASLIAAPPSPQTSIDNDWHSQSGQVPQSSPVGSVARFGPCVASLAEGRLLAVHRAVHARSRRSTPATFMPAAGDHVIDVFIAPTVARRQTAIITASAAPDVACTRVNQTQPR